MTLASSPFDQPAAVSTATPRRHRHVWWLIGTPVFPGHEPNLGEPSTHGVCKTCGVFRDVARSRRGASSRRLGADVERRIERVFGPRKVGEYGDACDHVGREWKWQSKATRGPIPAWLAAIEGTEPRVVARLPLAITRPLGAMWPLYPHLAPLVIRSYVRHGVATRDWLFMHAADWCRLHVAGLPLDGYVVLSGTAFLDLNGWDRP